MVIGKKQDAALISEKLTYACSWLLILLPVLLLAGSAAPDIACIVIGLGFLAYSASTRDWAWCRANWVKLVAIIYFYIVVRSIFTEFPKESLGRSAQWIRYPLLAAAICYWLYALPLVKKWLPKTLVLAVAFLIIDMGIQYVTGFDVIGRSSIISDGGAMRLTGPYIAPRSGITLVWLCWPAIAYLLISTKNSKEKLWAALLWGGCIVIIFLSGERMATLLAGLGSVLLILLVQETRRMALWLLPVSILAIGALIALNPALVTRQVDATVAAAAEAKKSPYGRLWVSSAKIIADAPLFGVGAKQFRNVCLKNQYGGSDILNCNLHPHHLYLEWWVEEGLVGLLLFMALIVIWTKEAWRYWRMHTGDILFVGLIIACIVKLFPFSTAISFFVNWSAIPFWLLMGWMLAKIREA
ncbi:MAG: O-antigen ligase family protein [Rickettsiales bacterium]